jgi:AcrR family transcriptional regulator
MKNEGFADMTVRSIADKAKVSAPTVYAIFGSKTGLISQIIGAATTDMGRAKPMRQAFEVKDPGARLRALAKTSRQNYEPIKSDLDVLLGGAGIVAPDLAKATQEQETRRYEALESIADYLRKTGRLHAHLNRTTARDVLWCLTGRELYRMLVHERRWKPAQYEKWLGNTLIEMFLRPETSAK